jgi:two-component system, sensor histidine kinase and response regulator
MPKILVIDDDAMPRDTIIKLLKFSGYETLEARDGRTGIQLAAEHLPDLVISDIRMPIVNGFDVLEGLRANPNTNAIPVVFVSALNDIKAIREGMNAGADDYLGKPYSGEELLRVVDTQLKKKNLVHDKFDTSLKVLRKNIIYALPHEFRTPLSLILGYGQILESDYKTIKPEELLESAQVIVSAGNRLQRLIENYLVYAQIELIQGDPNEVEQLRNYIIKDVAQIIEKVAGKIAAKYQRTADLTLDLCPLALRISEPNLKKIVEELVDNAFKFSAKGSKVVIKSAHEKDSFKFYIRDYGRGMTTEQIKSLGAYMQFNRALFEQQGLGLGFTLAQRLVELHSGKLRIESRPDQGTAIGIEMPLY